MKTPLQDLSELEVTACMVMAAFVALVLMLGFMVWERVAPLFPHAPSMQRHF